MTACPIQQTLYPALKAGGNPPDATESGIALGELVPKHCVRCSLWQNRRTRWQCGHIHLWALNSRQGAAARVLRNALYQVGQNLDLSREYPERISDALRHLQDAHGALSTTGPHRDALEPTYEKTVHSVLGYFKKHPEALFRLVDGAEPDAPDERAWTAYTTLVSDRVSEEGGTSEAHTERAIYTVRGTTIHLGARETPQPHGASDACVRVVGAALSAALKDWQGAPWAAIVALAPSNPSVLPIEDLPTWLVRLLDPRPDPVLVNALVRELTTGETPPSLTEPFLTAEEWAQQWPRSIVLDAFHQLSAEGMGRLVNVRGVGPTLALI